MAKVFSSIGVYDTLSTSFKCCCSYDDENILLGNNSGFFKYNIFTKTITQIYSASLDLNCMAYYDDNIYYVNTPTSSYTSQTINKLNINTLSKTSSTLSSTSSTADYRYDPGTIKIVQDGIIVSLGYVYVTGGTQWTRESYTKFIALKISFDDFPNTITLFSSSTDHTGYNHTYYKYPISSILTPTGDGYKIFWYSYIYDYNGTVTTYAKQGYTSNMTPVLSLSTFDNEVGTFNAFEDNDNYYILTNKYLIELNKETEATRVLRDNPTELAPLHYAYVGDDVYAISGANLIKLTVNDVNISYDIKSQDGTQTLASVTNSAPISKFIFNYDGDNVVAELTTLSGVQYLYYTPQVISGKRLAGYSTKPNAINPEYNINEIYNVAITDNLTFYEVYKDYKPPARTFEINLYKNSAEPNRLDKTDYLEQVGTLYGAFRKETSLLQPTLIVELNDIPNFNYCYIPPFNRYYYINNIISIKKGLWELDLSIDVLMSYKLAILNCSGFVERNEFNFNSKLIDDKRVIEQGVDVEEYSVSNSLFDTTPSFIVQGFALQLEEGE